MLSKSQTSFVSALHQKKYRKEHALFIAEGIKSVKEFIESKYSVDTIFCTSASVPKLGKIPQKVKLYEVTGPELKKISTLTTPQDVLALIRIPEQTEIMPESFAGKFTLLLDGIQDPGNLGTIIRTADWFGFTEIICSADTVEAYNPKVVQASMGSLSRINIQSTDLETFLPAFKLPVFGAFLEGESVYNTNMGTEGFLVLGNEGKGISDKTAAWISRKITIPRFGNAESLNVAISAAILCSEIRRKTLK